MTSKIIYSGELRTVAEHIKSEEKIVTDAPVDNHGKGEAFSPTDLVATALGSCMLTVMGIKANNLNVNIDATRVEIQKIMASEPRRISEIKIDVYFPTDLDTSTKKSLEFTAVNCPVAKSLHPELSQNITFHYPSGTS